MAVFYLRGPNKRIGGIKTAGEIKIINKIKTTGGIKTADETKIIKKIKKIIINFLIFN